MMAGADGVDNSKEAPSTNLAALPAGRNIGRYKILSLLGQGSFGITYRARDDQLGRDVAIKEYLPAALAWRQDGVTVAPRSTQAADDFIWGRQRFVAEGRTLATLHNAPGIVKVFDFLEDHGTAYIVMELVDGGTLESHLQARGRMDAVAIKRIVWPLLDGLEQVHDAGFLHRDIKPANILLNAKGQPTLIDFGASRAAMAGRSQAITAIFTPGYAAAEQFTSANQGPPTDIYGLSATLYHAITGGVPPNAIDRMMDDGYRPLRGLSPAGFPMALLTGIDAGLVVRSSHRPQSIEQWRSMLSASASASVSAPTVVRPRPPAKPGPAKDGALKARRQQFLWAGIAALAIIVAASAWFSRPVFQGAAVQALTAEELSKALEERRKADAAAAEKARLEQAAAVKVAADADAKQKADADLAAAQAQRRKAEEELAKLRADIEARQQAEAKRQADAAAASKKVLEEAAAKSKVEAEMAALKKAQDEAEAKAAADAAAKRTADQAAQRHAEADAATKRAAEEEAQKKATAEAAAKREADDQLAKTQVERQKADEFAARQKADLDTKQKAETEAKSKAEQEATDKKAAEAAETALRLGTLDRQHTQVALTSQGFDTRGSDGVFGPRTRDMIAAWQKAHNQPATGFLTASQQQLLIKEGTAAVSRFDDDQKKAEEDRKKAEEEARAKAAAAVDPARFDGAWRRNPTMQCQNAPEGISFSGLTVRDGGKFAYSSVGEHHRETCNVQINSDGSFRNDQCLLQLRGQFSGDVLQLSYLNPSYGTCNVSARRGE